MCACVGVRDKFDTPRIGFNSQMVPNGKQHRIEDITRNYDGLFYGFIIGFHLFQQILMSIHQANKTNVISAISWIKLYVMSWNSSEFRNRGEIRETEFQNKVNKTCTMSLPNVTSTRLAEGLKLFFTPINFNLINFVSFRFEKVTIASWKIK